MNILLLTVYCVNDHPPTFETCTNHFVGYALQIKRELELVKPDCNVALKTIDYLLYPKYKDQLDKTAESCDVLFVLGYYKTLDRFAEWVQTLRDKKLIDKSIPIYTLSTCPYYNKELKANGHFEMMLKSSIDRFYWYEGGSVEHRATHNHQTRRLSSGECIGKYGKDRISESNIPYHQLPIPQTLTFERNAANASENLRVCIDGPWREKAPEGTHLDMPLMYEKIISALSESDLLQLSPSVGYYKDMGLDTCHPPSEIVEVPYMPMSKLQTFLSSIDHFIIVWIESYGGMVADCLSAETVVHYPVPPLVVKPALNFIHDTSVGNCIPFASIDELCVNIQQTKFKRSESVPNKDVFKYITQTLLAM